jgi:uroporphyrinogen decarboxylase
MDMNQKPKAPLLVRTLRGEAVERTPIWAMRQAGRWDPEFRRLRQGLTFFEFSENAELSAAASLCPLRFGVDAIILFYDITTLAVSMGQPFQLVPQRGPVPNEPIHTIEQVKQLASDPDPSTYGHVLEIYDRVARELKGDIPILVFAGAPFTMATYQTGIGRDLIKVRQFVRENRMVWDALLARTADATVSFLQTLIQRGAAAYQLFDSWAGGLSEEEYLEFSQPYHEQIFAAVPGPSILFVKEVPYVDHAARSGCRVLSLGTSHSIPQVKAQHPHLIVQGNVDHLLLVEKSESDVARATRQCLEQGGGERHILNLDHGMDPNARVENFATFVETAKSI